MFQLSEKHKGFRLMRSIEHPLQSSSVCSLAAFRAGKASPCHRVLLKSTGPLPCCWHWQCVGNNVWFISSLAQRNMILQGRCTLGDSTPTRPLWSKGYFSVSPVAGNSLSPICAIIYSLLPSYCPTPKMVYPWMNHNAKMAQGFLQSNTKHC